MDDQYLFLNGQWVFDENLHSYKMSRRYMGLYEINEI